MARRKTARKTRRTRRSVSVLGTAQTVLVANALTRGAFNSNLYEFATGRTQQVNLYSTPSGFQNMTGGLTAYAPNLTDSIITLPEMLGFDGAGITGYNAAGQKWTTRGKAIGPNFPTTQIMDNIKANAFTMGTQLITIPIGFKIAKKVLGKSGMTRAFNKGMKFIGMNEVKA